MSYKQLTDQAPQDIAAPKVATQAHDFELPGMVLARLSHLGPADDMALRDLLLLYPGYGQQILMVASGQMGLAAVQRALRAVSGQPAQTAPTNAQELVGRIARGRVDIGGSADESDRDVVVAELAQFPLSALRLMVQENRRVVVCRNSILEIMPELREQAPRGWEGTGKTWGDVPGVGEDGHGRTVIAIRNGHVPATGDGHNAINLVMHEVAHGLDRSLKQSGTTEFRAAQVADRSRLGAYEGQGGMAGLEESYAESFARFYARDPKDALAYPHLHAYWTADPLAALVRQ